MEWEFIVALAVAIPVIFFPAAFIWYLNVGGIYGMVRDVKARRIAREKAVEEEVVIDKFDLTRDKES